MPSDGIEVSLFENTLILRCLFFMVIDQIRNILVYPNKCYDETTNKAYSIGVHRSSKSCYELECIDNYTMELRT